MVGEFCAYVWAYWCLGRSKQAGTPGQLSARQRDARRKNRTPGDAQNYQFGNGGKPISVTSFFAAACKLDQKIPDDWRTDVPPAAQSHAIPGFEDWKIIVGGYLLGVRFEGQPGGDHDFHCEISDSKNWQSQHLVVEVPPGEAFCGARKAVWDLVKQDAAAAGKTAPAKGWVFHHPPHVRVWGLAFWDLHHGKTDTCNKNGNRGIRLHPGDPSMVRGLWELHPVVKVDVVQN
ncbi:MAG: hypothetical protein ACREMY_06615 [bacterium]